MDEEVWIFGYGSLIWRADFDYAERIPGFIRGFERRFWQLSEDHRGVPGKPGRVVTLVPSTDPEREVWGVAYRLHKDCDKVLAQLDHREKGGYERTTSIFHCRDDREHSWSVTLYLAAHDNPLYSPHRGEIMELAQQVHKSVGPSGPNTEYVLRLAEAVRELGGPSNHDHHLFELEQQLLALQLS